MDFLFWLALVIGGGLFLLSLFSDVVGTGHAEGAAFDAAIGAHVDTDWGDIFSLRNATYFLFAFGAVGVLLENVWGGHQLLALAFALLTGGAAWALSHGLFKYLRKTESGQMQGDRLLIGRVGEVTLPILRDRLGKISVMRAGQSQELLARPLNDDDDPASWDSVLVVEVRDGVALVTPYSDAQLVEEPEE